MEDPEYIVLVALDTPSRKTGIYISGGVMAAPTVGAVLSDILPYLDVEREAVPGVTLPDLTGMSLKEAQKQLKSLGLTGVPEGNGTYVYGQLPEAGEMVPVGTQVLIYLKEDQLFPYNKGVLP
jgi:stage V sporulation protein D (sporulation-specific penicillin-binding protein)